MLLCVTGPMAAGKNAAADILVNRELGLLASGMHQAGISFKAPPDGLYADVDDSETAENLYEKLLADNPGKKALSGSRGRDGESFGGKESPDAGKDRGGERSLREETRGSAGTRKLSGLNRLFGRLFQNGALGKSKNRQHNPPEPPRTTGMLRRSYANGFRAYTGELPDDLVLGLPAQALEQEVGQMLARASAARDRAPSGNYYVPPGLYTMDSGAVLEWKKLLNGLLSEADEREEASYATPDRKYLYRDMIVPGPGRREKRPEKVWAFVDSSASVGREDMERFLTQLRSIVRRYRCGLNVAYWNTEVTDVYKDIRSEEALSDALPNFSGGTDINCVYRWIRGTNVKAEAVLILTDGYFGELSDENRIPGLRRKTILILTNDAPVTEKMRRIGKTARLK